MASIRSSGASQSTIKLVATNLIASGRLNGKCYRWMILIAPCENGISPFLVEIELNLALLLFNLKFLNGKIKLLIDNVFVSVLQFKSMLIKSISVG